jgi:NAD(P)-dependent dehydrogenase (short-subunit alcohol dehydrogenase family)
VALALAREGADLGLLSRTADELKGVASEVQRVGRRASFWICDVTRPDDVQRSVTLMNQTFGRVDILINNAGGADSSPVVNTDLKSWNDTLELNLTPVFLFCRSLLPRMIQQGYGRIVNVASIAGKLGAAYVAAYSAAKHGVLGFTKSLALELLDTGILVNAVCPGYVDTPMTQANIRKIVEKTGRSLEEVRKKLESFNPQGRFMTPEEVAEKILELAADDCQRNGEAIDLW